MTHDDPLTWLGETDWRNQHQLFGIRLSDRRYHMAIVGRTGMGKSTLMRTMMRSDIAQGSGFALVDPHGDLASDVATYARERRAADLIYLNPATPDGSLALNPLEVAGAKPHLVASGVLGVFKKFWEEYWGPRMEHIFRNVLLALVPLPGATLAHVADMLLDADFRRRVLVHVKDENVRKFWLKEFAQYRPQARIDAVTPILNKIGQFLAIPEVRKVVCQPKSAFDLRKVMDEKRIFVANLSKGLLGEDSSALLGALLITKFELAALSRANVSRAERNDFFLYVDEFPTMATQSFAGILSESRKYALSIVVGLQYIDQIEKEIRDALFENVGTLAIFRVGPATARILETQMEGLSEKT